MLIGISGKKRAGKDTVAAIIKAVWPTPTIVYPFAKPLKAEVARACGVSVEYLEANKDMFRLILQGWGTDFRRTLNGQGYWIRQMERALTYLGDKCVVIPDVRFKNELEFVRKSGGVTLRVERLQAAIDLHISENDLDGSQFDYTIDNNGSLGELVNQVNTIINKIK